MQGGEEKAERFSVKQKAAGEARKGRDQSSRAGMKVPSPSKLPHPCRCQALGEIFRRREKNM